MLQGDDLRSRLRNLGLPALDSERQIDRFARHLESSFATLERMRRGIVDLDLRASRDWLPLQEVLQLRDTNPEEAIWLCFLATQVGWDRPDSCWILYSAFSGAPEWTWPRASGHMDAFARWVEGNHSALAQRAPFGNHRKFETHKLGRGTPDALRTYVRLVGESQVAFLRDLADTDRTFDRVFNALHKVVRFGRTARYDFTRLLVNLALFDSIGLTDVAPRSLYLSGATGPLRGAERLFGLPEPARRSRKEWLAELDRCGLELAEQFECDPQVVEDALCNWQK